MTGYNTSAVSCGFQSASYFTYVFRKEIEISPQRYRQENGIVTKYGISDFPM
ncbi:AraC family transcriptional regulator [Anaerotaenia torta]|uniref:AraC family transcriptional regulator n=1 Tax=Anaerotaenia torta TaxID=433293 RepID=UPI003D195027